MNVGIIGIGFMGMIHFHAYRAVRGARVSAICETIPHRRRGDWRDIKGNFGPAGSRVDLSGVSAYANIEELLADESVDLVDICLPPALHADTAIQAMRAGKHVFCEKPMALSVIDARRMARVARQTQRQLMIGHVLPMFPEYRLLHQLAQRGKYGRLLGGHFYRVISDPAWLRGYYDPDWIGGPMLDLHIHDAHFIRLLFDMPTAVQGVGRMQGRVAKHFEMQYLFGKPEWVVTATGGVIDQSGRPFWQGFEVQFERATVAFSAGVLQDQPRTAMPLTAILGNGRARELRVTGSDPMLAFQSELNAVVRGVRTGKVPEFLNHPLAEDAIRICHAETKAIATGQRVSIRPRGRKHES